MSIEQVKGHRFDECSVRMAYKPGDEGMRIGAELNCDEPCEDYPQCPLFMIYSMTKGITSIEDAKRGGSLLYERV